MEQEEGAPGGVVSGVRTPPVRMNSKLASLGRIFKPWKWRKKKRQNPSAVERKAAVPQNPDQLVRRGLEGTEPECCEACGGVEDPDTPSQSDAEEEEPLAPLATTSEDLVSDEDNPSTVVDLTEDIVMVAVLSQSEERGEEDSSLCESCVDSSLGHAETGGGQETPHPMDPPP
uniref:Phosphatase and actin regulator 3a n=1 Tax=Hucho hucho TaxID=62062 RepID=A0A4W5K523_9TELE